MEGVMGDTSGGFTNLEKRSSGFTLIEIMIVIAVAGILAVVTIPKYQGLIDHYHLESSAQIVAGQLRNAKQYSMDRRTNVYVMFNSTSVQVFYVDANYKYSPLEGQQSFDSGITYVQEDSQGLVNIPSSVTDKDDISHELHDIPQHFDKCFFFNRKGFLSVDFVDIVLTNGSTPSQSVMVSLNPDSLAVKITWL